MTLFTVLLRFSAKWLIHINTCTCNWPASREKGPSDISNSVDKDQPLNVVEIQLLRQLEMYVPLMWRVSKSADSVQTRGRRRGGWSWSTLFAYVRRSLFAWRWPYNFTKEIEHNDLLHQTIFAPRLMFPDEKIWIKTCCHGNQIHRKGKLPHMCT